MRNEVGNFQPALAPGKRTVTAVLRILGRKQETDFPIYHGVLNRAVWSSRTVASWLLRLLVASFLDADATVVMGLNDTIERRWGHKIHARGIYRDPVRSSKGHFVKACPREGGDQWSALVIRATAGPHFHGPARIMGLPFLSILAPSQRFYADTPRAPKALLDWARQAALQIHRWLPGRGSSSSVTPNWPPSASSPPSETMSTSSPNCASTPLRHGDRA
jgi:hypothetical protein